MMMKSIKGKVVTGVVAVGLLSGVGAAFANTDAGTQLKTWYDGQFNTANAAVVAGETAHVGSIASGIQTAYNGVKAGVTSNINGERDAQVTAKTDSINGTKNVYVKQVTDKEAALSAAMQSQFDGIFALANSQINAAGVAGFAYAKSDLTKQAGKDGYAAVTAVDTQLSAVQAKAKTDLETAITSAKTDLTNQLAADTTATTNSINAAIDAKVLEIQGLISQKAQELVDAQKALIDAQALANQQAAENELDSVVKGI